MADENLKKVIQMRMHKTGDALIKNNMEVYYADNIETVSDIIKNLIKPGDIIGSGGSVTLQQCEILDLIKSPQYKYIDRSKASSPDEIKNIYRSCFSADVYLTSANAITENGELYNVDGNSNRIAAIAYGPDSVIVIAGYNKIVKNLDEAINRVKSISAPANVQRLSCDSYCSKTGECLAFSNKKSDITAGCTGSGRICCNYLISAQQRIKNRIKVILVAEALGY